MKTIILTVSALLLALNVECIAGTNQIFEEQSTVSSSKDFSIFKKKKSRRGGNNATFGAEGHLGFIKMKEFKSFGLGASFIWNYNEKSSLFLGMEYFIPTSFYEGTTSLEAKDPYSTAPSTVSVSYKASVIRINANAHYYFVGANDDDFNMFALVGASFAMASFSETVGSYDAAKYNYSTASTSSMSQFYINIGVGTEIKVGPGNVYVNLQANIPANTVGNEVVEINLPFSLMAVGGYKIPF